MIVRAARFRSNAAVRVPIPAPLATRLTTIGNNITRAVTSSLHRFISIHPSVHSTPTDSSTNPTDDLFETATTEAADVLIDHTTINWDTITYDESTHPSLIMHADETQPDLFDTTDNTKCPNSMEYDCTRDSDNFGTIPVEVAIELDVQLNDANGTIVPEEILEQRLVQILHEEQLAEHYTPHGRMDPFTSRPHGSYSENIVAGLRSSIDPLKNESYKISSFDYTEHDCGLPSCLYDANIPAYPDRGVTDEEDEISTGHSE